MEALEVWEVREDMGVMEAWVVWEVPVLAWVDLAWEDPTWEDLAWEVLTWEDLTTEDLVWEAWEDMEVWEVAWEVWVDMEVKNRHNTVSNHHSLQRLNVMLSLALTWEDTVPVWKVLAWEDLEWEDLAWADLAWL